jgi:hypothetical protein
MVSGDEKTDRHELEFTLSACGKVQVGSGRRVHARNNLDGVLLQAELFRSQFSN